MQTIKYKFADGTTNEVEVTEEIYLIHLELLQQEKRNHWRETRRHTSLYYLIENGIDFEDKSADTLAIIIRRENTESFLRFIFFRIYETFCCISQESAKPKCKKHSYFAMTFCFRQRMNCFSARIVLSYNKYRKPKYTYCARTNHWLPLPYRRPCTIPADSLLSHNGWRT